MAFDIFEKFKAHYQLSSNRKREKMTISYFFKALKRKIVYKIAPICTDISPMLNTRLLYRHIFGRKLDLEHPVTFNDKILWLKFNTYWNNPLIKQCADKYRVREYIEKLGYPELLINMIAVYDKPDDIQWQKLPDSFAMKLNVGCGKNLIVQDKSKLDISATMKLLRAWMKDEYWRGHSEMQYKDVEKKILVEEYIGDKDGSFPDDYKFHCMNGECKCVMVCKDRVIGERATYFYFDRDWKLLPYSQEAVENPDINIPKPENMDAAFEYGERLSKDFPFVRVDLYIVKGKVYFGELTFTPSAGLDAGLFGDTDKIMGSQLILPIEDKKK